MGASNFAKTIEQHQHRKIACLEEIAYLNGWISRDRYLTETKFISEENDGTY